MSGPPSHLDLLAAARALRRAAVDGDPDIVHAELWRLRTQVMQHHHAEHDPVSSLTGALGQPVRDGQQRLLRVLGELLFGVEADDDTCTGIVRAAEVELLLRRQAKLEAAALRPRQGDRQRTGRPSSSMFVWNVVDWGDVARRLADARGTTSD